MLVIHASRSRYETFMHCPREGYLQFHCRERGIIKEGINIFLATGTWLHKGLEIMAKWLKANKGAKEVPEHLLGHFIQQIKEGYFQMIFGNGKGGFDLSLSGLDEEGNKRDFTEFELQQQQQYTFDEQSALVEAFMRIANLRLFPKWMERYRIITIENDMSFPLVKGEGFEVIQSSTIDLVLQEIESKDIYLVSYKGYKQFDTRTAKAASHDTQGLSESWAFEEFLRAKKIDKRVMGVKMLYFIKGQRKEVKRGSGTYEQNSPLIRGYRRLAFDGPEYAHSWFFPNPNNDSGIGALGKSWEKFDVFKGAGLQETNGVKGWIEKLASGEVQEECGDILAQQIVEPEAYQRHKRDIRSWLVQTSFKEEEIALKLLKASQWAGENHEDYMDAYFPQARNACHYPTDCQYLTVCYGTDEERLNPLENGFVYRTPHHKAELIQIGENP